MIEISVLPTVIRTREPKRSESFPRSRSNEAEEDGQRRKAARFHLRVAERVLHAERYVFAPLNVRSLNSDRSSIGMRWRTWSATNVDSAAAPTRTVPTVRPELQPYAVRVDEPVRQREHSMPDAASPGTSEGCSADLSRDSGISTTASRSAPAPIGAVMKKIQFQLRCSVRNPPTSGPIESACAQTPAQIPVHHVLSSAVKRPRQSRSCTIDGAWLQRRILWL
jgi:hypothetical protein